MPGPSPSRNDSVTTRTCPVCGCSFEPSGRRRHCSNACRQAAHRRRHQPLEAPGQLPPARPRRPVTVYECDGCGARELGNQYCGECRTFMRRIGVGGCCPACFEAVAYDELSAEPS